MLIVAKRFVSLVSLVVESHSPHWLSWIFYQQKQSGKFKLELGGQSILGYSEREMSDVRGNKMGMIFQEPMTSLNPAFTIGNQMIETLRRHRNLSK